jgi:hypothetical protein
VGIVGNVDILMEATVRFVMYGQLLEAVAVILLTVPAALTISIVGLAGSIMDKFVLQEKM